MNSLQGHIQSIEVSGKMSIVSVEIDSGLFLKSIVIDTPESADYLQKGKEITVLFKETEVIISNDKKPSISIENQLTGSVSNVEKGTLLSEITINIGKHQLVAIITTAALESLNLRTGSEVLALVKINDLMLSD